MAAIKELLGQGEVKKPTRNFLKENVRKLKELKVDKENKLNSQSQKSIQSLSDRKPQENIQKLSSSYAQQCRLRKSPPLTLKPGLGRTKSLTAVGPREINIMTSLSEDYTPKGYRSQASQTLNSKQLETLYHEGVVRFPSVRTTSTTNVSVREMGLQTERSPSPHESADNTGLQQAGDSNQAVNKDCTTGPEYNCSKTKTSDSRQDPNRAPSTYQRGVVPRYLKAHKKELEKERISRAWEAANECPEGHVMLPDDIRLSHLTTLKLKYEELVSQLNQLPVIMDTLRTRNRKKQIEEELDKIEIAISLFSREKVFVKANS